MLSKTTPIIRVIALMICASGFSQIGIGTTNPAPSSILDVESTTQGLLTPRMTSVQRTAITSPANGLMVFDTTVGSYFHYDTLTSSWIQMSGTKQQRLNYKLIKSTDVLATVLATELAAGGGTSYQLAANTLYEINGTITVDRPIQLNNAYLTGGDSGEDKLIRANGDLFSGTTGGTIRLLTLQATAGNVFNLIGTGQTQTLIFRDCIVTTSNSVGRIEGFGLVFLSVIQFIGNTNGIVYDDITRLLLSNTAWFSNNSNIYERLEGTFSLVQKQGGFSEVTGTKIGFDVSQNPIITGDAVMESVVFTGTLTSGKYVNAYTSGTYTGFNFNNNWTVRCTGIPTEGDSDAKGTVYMNRNPSTQVATPVGTLNTAVKLTIAGGLTSNLFRTSATNNNRITYLGKKGRLVQVNANISFGNASGNNNTEYVFFIMRIPAAGGTDPQVASEIVLDTNAGYAQAFPIQGSVFLNTNDAVEIWIRRQSQTNANAQTFTIRSFSMTLQ